MSFNGEYDDYAPDLRYLKPLLENHADEVKDDDPELSKEKKRSEKVHQDFKYLFYLEKLHNLVSIEHNFDAVEVFEHELVVLKTELSKLKEKVTFFKNTLLENSKIYDYIRYTQSGTSKEYARYKTSLNAAEFEVIDQKTKISQKILDIRDLKIEILHDIQNFFNKRTPYSDELQLSLIHELTFNEPSATSDSIVAKTLNRITSIYQSHVKNFFEGKILNFEDHFEQDVNNVLKNDRTVFENLIDIINSSKYLKEDFVKNNRYSETSINLLIEKCYSIYLDILKYNSPGFFNYVRREYINRFFDSKILVNKEHVQKLESEFIVQNNALENLIKQEGFDVSIASSLNEKISNLNKIILLNKERNKIIDRKEALLFEEAARKKRVQDEQNKSSKKLKK